VVTPRKPRRGGLKRPMDIVLALIATISILYVLVRHGDVVMAISTAILASIWLLIIGGIMFLVILFLIRGGG
jgi:hypothetical protein